MIEVNLYSVPNADANARVGRCIARNRFDKESMGVSIESFIKGFLKDNVSEFETIKSSNAELVELINSDINFTRKDVACINHFLSLVGYKLTIWNVADDEDNATGVAGDAVEWNVIDRNFIQYDYPTVTKIVPGDGNDVVAILHQIVDRSGLFTTDKFAGMKNPFKELFDNLDKIKSITGSVSTTIVSRIYELLDQLDIDVFCATSEE